MEIISGAKDYVNNKYSNVNILGEKSCNNEQTALQEVN